VTYGESFVTAVEHGSFYGVQFHPEKSSAAGLRLLANFARICLRRPISDRSAGAGAARPA
jgi:glutamine amidotransferase